MLVIFGIAFIREKHLKNIHKAVCELDQHVESNLMVRANSPSEQLYASNMYNKYRSHVWHYIKRIIT